jgi:hypothetical protein
MRLLIRKISGFDAGERRNSIRFMKLAELSDEINLAVRKMPKLNCYLQLGTFSFKIVKDSVQRT